MTEPEQYPDFAEPGGEPMNRVQGYLDTPEGIIGPLTHEPMQEPIYRLPPHPGWDVVQAERRYGPILGRVLRAETLSEDTPTDLASRDPVGPYRYDQEPL